MSKNCVLSFFDNDFQRKLKESCFGDHAFEITLNKYRDAFLKDLGEVNRLDKDKKCDNCKECLIRGQLFDEYVSFLNDFLDDVKKQEDLIRDTFNEIISIYEASISSNRKKAIELMEIFASCKCANNRQDNILSLPQPMFRVRKIGDYDGHDIHELFHTPFNRRHKVSNQRYSIAGNPLLYVAETLPLALKEIGCNSIDRVNAAVFVKKAPEKNDIRVIDVSNPIFRDLVWIGVFLASNREQSYNNNYNLALQKRKLRFNLASYVLSQILQFPVQNRKNHAFVEEYVLPQLFMNYVNEYAWLGVSYETSKSHVGKRDGFMQYAEKNICYNVPYVANSNYNDRLLDSFYYATWSSGDEGISFDDLTGMMEDYKCIIDAAVKNGRSMKTYLDYYHGISFHIQKMKIIIGEQRYKSRKDCKVEMTLLFRLFEKLQQDINIGE